MRSAERKKQYGEVWTPIELVNKMLDRFPAEAWTNPSKTHLDPTCGHGNFLVEVLKRRLDGGVEPCVALETLYGVDIMQDNVDEAKKRLWDVMVLRFGQRGFDRTRARFALNKNIVKADALTYDYNFETFEEQKAG